MSAATLPVRSLWLPPLLAAGAGLLGLGLLFQPEIRAAVEVWWTSTAFGHCVLVLPIAGWLAWERRALLQPLRPRPLPALALLALPCGVAWLLAERLGIMEGRQLAALAMVWVLVPAAFGIGVGAAMAAPLAFLVFLVPFGAFLVPSLQGFTARFIDAGLSLLAIPHYVDQVVIDIPEGRFLVAEACAGLRFLIAAVAFGALYALLIYRSPGRRLVFLAVSVVVPILANGMRALGIVLLGHALGSAEAGAVDHVLYGWLFFSVVILLLIVLGLPFREDRVPFVPQHFMPYRGPVARGGGQAAVACVLAVCCLGPAAAWALNQAGAGTGRVALSLPPSCQAVAERQYLCAGAVVLRVRPFGPRAGAGLVEAALQAGDRALDGDEVEHGTIPVADGSWRISAMGQPEKAEAAAVWLAGRPSAGGLRDRFTLALTSLGFSGGAPAVTTLSAVGPGAIQSVRALAGQVGVAAE